MFVSNPGSKQPPGLDVFWLRLSLPHGHECIYEGTPHLNDFSNDLMGLGPPAREYRLSPHSRTQAEAFLAFCLTTPNASNVYKSAIGARRECAFVASYK